MTVGERIKKLRTEVGVLQSGLGKAIGFSGQVISNIERGYTQPSTELVNRCAAYFGVPADYILGRTSIDYSAESTTTATVFSTRIRERMEKLQMSLADLSNASNITENSCSAILAGKEIPNIEVIAKLSGVLGTTIDYLSGSSEYCCAIDSEEEFDIVMKYRQLSKKGKRIFLGMMESLEDK